MRAMVLERPGEPLELVERAKPQARQGQVIVKVHACAVCRTDLHVLDGDLPDVRPGIIPGHEIVGRVEAAGPGARWHPGERVGVPWLGYTCGQCAYCRRGEENLCDAAKFTGYQLDGGYADYVAADHRYAFRIPDGYSDVEAAPLLCAGLIGYRCLVKAGNAQRIGLYGFGAAAHIIAQVCVYQKRQIYAFTRSGDETAQQFALSLGAAWAGASDETPPVSLDAAIIFAPVGSLVPVALRHVRKGGTVVCGGIHMSDIPRFPYEILWGERHVLSVANLTRRDAEEFLALAPRVPVKTHVETFPLERANAALERLREGKLSGAAVLVTNEAG